MKTKAPSNYNLIDGYFDNPIIMNLLSNLISSTASSSNILIYCHHLFSSSSSLFFLYYSPSSIPLSRSHSTLTPFIPGAIPRLWEIRHLTEEIKTSADPAIMYGAHFFLHHLMPTRMARFILNLVHRNSSVCLSNLQGPEQAVTIGTHRLHRILYTMSPPPPVSIVFNVISYNGQLGLTVVTTSKLLPCARQITKQFKCQIEMLSELLSKRRVPGEVRTRKAQQQSQQQQAARNSQFLLDAPFNEDPMFTQDLATKLNHVQLERYYMSEMLEAHPANRDDIEYRLEELKEEFTDLMKQLRRRKSMAEYGIHNIIINVEVRSIKNTK